MANSHGRPTEGILAWDVFLFGIQAVRWFSHGRHVSTVGFEKVLWLVVVDARCIASIVSE